MKKYAITTLATVSMLVASCASMADFGMVKTSEVGVARQVLPATVIAVENKTIETPSTNRNVGTAVGAAVGIGAGQLLGGGKGRLASAAGMGVVGALAGRYLTDQMGRTKGQEITVKLDGTGEVFSFVQPIYKQVGAIYCGMHGNYYHGSGSARFVPDGQAYSSMY